jgi:hypothetical protein
MEVLMCQQVVLATGAALKSCSSRLIHNSTAQRCDKLACQLLG